MGVPIYITIVFILTAFLTVLFLFRAANYSKVTIAIVLLWMLGQGIIGYSGFYTTTNTIPPRFILLAGPTLILIIALFLTKSGKNFIDRLDLKILTWLHVVRIPVELVLFWLYQQGKVPKLMTFEGRNFDILSGLTAPFIIYFGFTKTGWNKRLLLVWNAVCLGLLINIVMNAVLSAPSPFQQFALDQPNIAILYFPFVWLPGLIVPIVLFSHLTAFRKLKKSITSSN